MDQKKFFLRLRPLIGLLPIFLFLNLAFQNCSPSFITKPLGINKLTDSGNGGTYDGKLNAYYRYIPNYKCNGVPSPAQIATEEDGLYVLQNVSGSQCSDQAVQISPTDVMVSPFQNEFISIYDNLFKRYEKKAVGIPASLAEVLCRDNFENPKLEIISHFNRETNEAVTRIYSAESNIADFGVSRVLSMNDVRYVSDKIKFSVNFSSVVQSEKKYSGQLESSSVAGINPQGLTCIIGGSLDTSNWSIKNLTDRDVQTFSIQSNDEVRFSSYMPSLGFFAGAPQHTFKVGFNFPEVDITAQTIGAQFSVQMELPTPLIDQTHHFNFYNAYPFNNSVDQNYYIWDSIKSRSAKMTNLDGNTFSTSRETDVTFSKAAITPTEEVLFEVSVPAQKATYLRSYNIDSGSMTNILRSNGKSRFQVLKNSKKVLMAYYDTSTTSPTYRLYDLIAKSFQKFTLQIPANCTPDGEVLATTNDEKNFIDSATCGSDKQFFLISIADGSARYLTTNKIFWYLSVDNKWAFFRDNLNKKSQIVSLEKFNSTDSNIYPLQVGDAYTPLVNQAWYGVDADAATPHLIRTDLVTQKSDRICPNITGTIRGVGAIPGGKIYVFTYDLNLKVYRFYQVTSSLECSRINEFPSEFPVPRIISSTDIGFAMTTQVTPASILAGLGIQPSEVIFVPIDGRPPLKLSTTEITGWSVDLTPDKKHVVFLGPDSTGKRFLKSFEFINP